MKLLSKSGVWFLASSVSVGMIVTALSTAGEAEPSRDYSRTSAKARFIADSDARTLPPIRDAESGPAAKPVLMFDWNRLSEGQVLVQGQRTTQGQGCITPPIQVRISKAPKSFRREYRIERDPTCQIVVKELRVGPAAGRKPRVTKHKITSPSARDLVRMTAHSARDLVFRGNAYARTVSWTPKSFYASASIQFAGDSPNAGIDGGMDYEYDPEWPGGLVVLNGASSYCWWDGTAYEEVCADPWWPSVGFEAGPGPIIYYGATNYFGSPYGYGELILGFMAGSSGDGECFVGSDFPDVHSKWAYVWGAAGWCQEY